MAEFTPAVGFITGLCQVSVQPWRVSIDEISNARRFEVGIVMTSPMGLRLNKSLRLGFQGSNNEVEYETLIARLRAALKLGAEEVEIFSDSRLVVSQVEGSFEAKDPRIS